MTAQSHNDLRNQIDSQHAQIINHLMTKGKLTTWDAIQLYGCTKLSTRCSELIRRGFEIKKEWIRVGEKRKRVVQYSM